MSVNISDETKVQQYPERFAIKEPSKIVTFIKGEPPTGVGRGKRNPIITNIYNALTVRRNEWAHVDIQITNAKQKAAIIASLYARARKDNLYISSRSMFNDRSKTYELWVMLSA
jgi:hypothetical protein